MNKKILACALALALPLGVANAADTNDGNWHGSGEAGLAVASGNAKSQNLNAKLTLKKEDEQWKYDFFLEALRNKSTVTTQNLSYDPATNQYSIVGSSKYDLSANRYAAGASAGYKLDERSYIVGAARYEHDSFSPYWYQYTLSIGYGYQLLKNASDELSFEVGPGYRVLQPREFNTYTTVAVAGQPPVTTVTTQRFDSEKGAVARGLANYKHNFNDTTSLVNTFLVEANGDNTYMQNDLGVQVKMTDKLALKAGYQVRYNTDVTAGTKHADQLVTTNVVYGF